MVELLMESPILLFGPVVGLLVVLLLLLWLMGRRRKSSPKGADNLAASSENENAEPNFAENTEEDDELGSFTIIRRDDETNEPAVEMQNTALGGQDATSSAESDLSLSDAAIANAERLAAIEQEMLAVRDLYRQDKITKDVYVSETRSLFEEAKKLTSD